MSTLSTDLRSKLERTAIAARNLAEKAAKAALESVAVQSHEAYGHMTKEQKDLRNKLRARARQLGDTQDAKGQLSIRHLTHECAYEHWHRMLFARFLAENNLLIEPEMRMPISLNECKELAEAEKTNVWVLAGRYAQTMLPEIFRADDPVLQVPLAREDQLKLEQLLDGLSADVFTASDSLGWNYQFWQTEQKETVNKSGRKIGADELPAVTQLFTEDYMVDFLLDNTLGAWHAGKVFAASPKLAENAKSEEELRKAVALPGCPWKYLRFIKGKNGKWTPAAGTFDGWPKTAKELQCLDPCMGSGHFVVAMFERLVVLRMAEEKLHETAAVPGVIRDNLFGLEIDARCTQIAAFNLALAAWRMLGHCALPAMNLACSGLAPNTREGEWLKIAGDNQKLQRGMERLYRLFQKAAVLGSLINPRDGESDLLVAAFHELQPLLEMALAQETKDDTAHELAVTARGLAKAAEILAGQFTLVATNVPYLKRGRQTEELQAYCEQFYDDAKGNLACAFVDRCLEFCRSGGAAGLVIINELLFLGGYRKLRERLLTQYAWNGVSRLGPGAFETITGEVVNVSLVSISNLKPASSNHLACIDVGAHATSIQKALGLREHEVALPTQKSQLKNPDTRIILGELDDKPLLSELAASLQGTTTGDNPRFLAQFWELPAVDPAWDFFQGAVSGVQEFGGCESIVRWEQGAGDLSRCDEARVQGLAAFGRRGIIVSQMGALPATRYGSRFFSMNTAVVLPKRDQELPAIWCFCSSPDFTPQVRAIDQALKVTNASLVKVPFDLAHWQKVAAEKYPHGLPKPFSSDPTQWLFNGHPKGSEQPLHVAVARLLGYQWPRQTGSSFPDCPALGVDGLEKFADADGIVCIPSVRGQEPAAERLRKLLAVAYDGDWKPSTELDLIRNTGSNASDFDEWLRNDFFEQHCDLFHQRPFVWHIWDGRKRDGFHALVNYHTLAGDKGNGRRALENLTHSYLGDWITRQKDSLKRGEEGADERLAAALALKERLEAIIEGKPPFDLFVRWKPLEQQAVGWEPDINDGVRMNIRPFLASDLPNGKKGAGILRSKPNVKWEKDRGNEPQRPKEEFPWFWKDGKFTGERVNDVHLTNEVKGRGRKA